MSTPLEDSPRDPLAESTVFEHGVMGITLRDGYLSPDSKVTVNGETLTLFAEGENRENLTIGHILRVLKEAGYGIVPSASVSYRDQHWVEYPIHALTQKGN